MDIGKKKPCKSTLKGFLLLLVSVGLTWACIFVGFIIGPLVLIIPLIICLYFLLTRRYITSGLFVLLSPFFFTFIFAVIQYTIGTGHLLFYGLPRTESYNLDPELRCGRVTGGCVVHGYEWVFQGLNNGAIRMMTASFGPMPGSYKGPYPSKEESLGALADAKPIAIEQMITDKITINRRNILLDNGVGIGLLRRLPLQFIVEMLQKGDKSEYNEYLEKVGPIKATVWQDRCLILQIPSDSHYDEEAQNDSARIAVIDCEKGRPFAYYGQGDYKHHFPPVFWLKRH